ncbi:MAG: Uma2 family endonuclease [Flammeovirgaceae bacterium]
MKLSDLDTNKTYSYADYLLWQLKERVELIKGKLFKMPPAPSMQHQRVSGRIYGEFWSYFKNKPCEVFSAPFDVRLPKKSNADEKVFTVVQPDICIVCDKEKLDRRGCIGAPDLVIEILSPGNSKKEMQEKFDVYEEAGVREYWLVDFYAKNVIMYVLKDNQYIGLKPFTEDVMLNSYIFPEITIELAPVFAED